MLNLLWLLLPIACAGGWFAGRRSLRDSNPDDFWKHAFNYHRGLNYLLNEPLDAVNEHKPVELFVGNRDIDQDTAETHLALGNLYRRRGELDRAILVHQSVVDKEQLDVSTRELARFELARDYDSAGLFDRAESLLQQLVAGTHQRDLAYRNLLSLYERESDWEQAIKVAREMQKQTGADNNQLLAHYHCELAHLALSAETDKAFNDPQQAHELLLQALAANSACSRAQMMLAQLAFKRGDYQEVIERYEIVEQLRPELMPEIISPLLQALTNLGDQSRLRAYVARIESRLNAYSVVKTTRATLEQLDGVAAADEFFKEQIVKRPSLKGLRDWAHGQLSRSRPEERDKIAVMVDMLDQVVKEKPGYVCADCGFSGQSLHWRCPGCGHWDTVHTVIGAEGE